MSAGTANDFQGKLIKDDQFRNGLSLTETLHAEMDGAEVGFDWTDLYDGPSGETIKEDALCGKYTFADLVAFIKEFHKNHQ